MRAPTAFCQAQAAARDPEPVCQSAKRGDALGNREGKALARPDAVSRTPTRMNENAVLDPATSRRSRPIGTRFVPRSRRSRPGPCRTHSAKAERTMTRRGESFPSAWENPHPPSPRPGGPAHGMMCRHPFSVLVSHPISPTEMGPALGRKGKRCYMRPASRRSIFRIQREPFP